MQKLLLFTVLAFALTFSACTEDKFSQVVDIPIPEHTSLPVIALEILSGDTILYPLLSRSYGITEDEPTGTDPNTLRFFKNGELIGEVTSTIDALRFDRPSLALAEPIDDSEAIYEVVGEVAGYGTATATQVMPAPPVFRVVSFEREGAIDEEGFRLDEAIIEIQDPAGIDNYYGFSIKNRFIQQFDCDTLTPPNCDTIFGTNTTFVTSPDPLLTYGGNYGLVVTDQSFAGSTYRIRVQFNSSRDVPPVLEVYSLTEDTYRYAVSFEAYQDARDNPFSEPVSVHNNIDDGYGFFLISNRKSEELFE